MGIVRASEAIATKNTIAVEFFQPKRISVDSVPAGGVARIGSGVSAERTDVP